MVVLILLAYGLLIGLVLFIIASLMGRWLGTVSAHYPCGPTPSTAPDATGLQAQSTNAAEAAK